MAKHKAPLSEPAELFVNSEGTPKSYESALGKFYALYYDELSSFYSKEIYQLSDEEISEFFIKLSLKRTKTIGSYSSAYRRYFEWLTDSNDKYLCRYSYHEYDVLITEISAKLISKLKFNFINRNIVYDTARNLIGTDIKNEAEAIIILLFEGVNNGELEFNNLKYANVSNERLEILLTNKNNNKRKIQVAKDFCNIIEMCRNKYNKFYIMNGKTSATQDNRGNVNSWALNSLRDFRSKKYLNQDVNKFETKVLLDSGKCFYLSLIEQILIESGITGGLQEEHYRKVINRYKDSDDQWTCLKDIYEQYKLQKLNSRIDTSQYQNVYADIMGINNEHTDKADKDLGNAGEKYIEGLLIKQYGKDKVRNCTADGVGYDFKVENDGIITMYEVKSTRQDENKDFAFYMTIKEIKMAYKDEEKNKDEFKLCIVYFKGNNPESLYIIENPLSAFELIDNKAERIVDMDYEDSGFMPLEVKIKVPYDKIKEYKLPPNKL